MRKPSFVGATWRVFLAFVLCFPAWVIVDHNLRLERRGDTLANLTPQQIAAALQDGRPYNQQMFLSDLAQQYRETPGYRDCPVNRSILANPSLGESDLLNVEPCANAGMVTTITGCKLGSIVSVGIKRVTAQDNVDANTTFQQQPPDGVSVQLGKPFKDGPGTPSPDDKSNCVVWLKASSNIQSAAFYLQDDGTQLLRHAYAPIIRANASTTLVLLWNNKSAPLHGKGLLEILPFTWRELAQQLVAGKNKYPG